MVSIYLIRDFLFIFLIINIICTIILIGLKIIQNKFYLFSSKLQSIISKYYVVFLSLPITILVFITYIKLNRIEYMKPNYSEDSEFYVLKPRYSFNSALGSHSNGFNLIVNLILICLILIWIIGILIGYFKQANAKNIFNQHLDIHNITDLELDNLLKERFQDLDIKTKVNIYYNNVIKSPCSKICKKQFYILLPTSLKKYYESNITLLISVINHELYHIKHQDHFFYRIIMHSKIICWFNPIFLLLENIYSLSSEIYCDTCVLKKLDINNKIQYAKLLTELSSNQLNNTSALIWLTNNNKSELYRRIKYMSHTKQQTFKITKIFSSLILAISFIGTPLSVFAATKSINYSISKKLMVEDKEIVINNTISLQDIVIEEPDDEYELMEENDYDIMPFGFNTISKSINSNSYVIIATAELDSSTNLSIGLIGENSFKVQVCPVSGGSCYASYSSDNRLDTVMSNFKKQTYSIRIVNISNKTNKIQGYLDF